MHVYELPYPPSVNTYYRHVGSRVLISRDGRGYRKTVGQLLLLAGAKSLTGPLAVEVDLYPPDRRKRDLDNAPKAMLDALQAAGLYEDDSQIVDLHLRRLEPKPGGLAVVRIGKAAERIPSEPAPWEGKQ